MFMNNDIAEVWKITNTELVLNDGRRMRRDGARIDQGVCITSYASQCRTVDQVVVLPEADAKGWYVSLSRTREAMHVYTRDKAALRQSVMHLGERKSVWELVQALGRLKPQSIDPIMPALCHGTPSGKGSRDWNGALRPLSANKLTFEGSHHFCYLSASPDQDNERSTAIINTWLSWKKQ